MVGNEFLGRFFSTTTELELILSFSVFHLCVEYIVSYIFMESRVDMELVSSVQLVENSCS